MRDLVCIGNMSTPGILIHLPDAVFSCCVLTSGQIKSKHTPVYKDTLNYRVINVVILP